MRVCVLLSVAIVLAVSACAPGTPTRDEPAVDPVPAVEPVPGWSGTIEEHDGVVRVTNPDAALWDDTSNTPLTFELEQVFGAARDPEAAVLGAIGGAVVGTDGSVYVFDSEAAEIVGFAPDGTVRWRVGGDGEGPDEFSGVRGIAFDGQETIYLINREGSQLDAWGVDGAHQWSRSLADVGLSRAFMGGFLPPNRLALVDSVFEMGANDYVIVTLGDPLTAETRFRIGAEPMMHVPQGFIFQLSHYFEGSQILVGNWGQYVLRVFDDSGHLQRRVTRPGDYLRHPGFAAHGDRTAGISLGGLSAPIVLTSGHWLVYASWPTNVGDPGTYAETPADQRPALEWASSLDLFDADGRFLYSATSEGVPVPAIGRPWATAPGNVVFTVSTDPFPQVRRFRVVIDSPDDD